MKLNPFALSTTIRGLLIKDKDGEPFVSWDEVYVNFQLSSFLGHPWVFKEISVTGPFARVQMNKDGTLNFSDLIAKFSRPTHRPHRPRTPAKPVALWIGRLQITNATASVTDLTHRQPFKRLVGPLNFTLERFRAPIRTIKTPMRLPARRTPAKKFRGTDFFISTRCVRGAS